MRSAIFGTLALIATAGHVHADALGDCNQNRNADIRIKGCSEVVATQGASVETRATALRHRAAAQTEKGARDKAMADLDEAIKIKPDYALAYLARGQLRLARSETLDAAIADLTQAIRGMPNSAIAYNTRGYAHLSKGNLDNALADFSEAIGIDPKSASARNNRGLTFRKKEMLDRAVADYTGAIEINPSYARAYANRASAYEAWGKPQEAAADYARAAELDPLLRSERSGAKRAGADKRIAMASGISATRGKMIAQKNCAWCHGIQAKGASPNPRAPEFRILYTRHPIESLREPLSRRIATPHDEMPKFALADDEIDSIIAYINTVTPRR